MTVRLNRLVCWTYVSIVSTSLKSIQGLNLANHHRYTSSFNDEINQFVKVSFIDRYPIKEPENLSFFFFFRSTITTSIWNWNHVTILLKDGESNRRRYAREVREIPRCCIELNAKLSLRYHTLGDLRHNGS